MKIKAKLVSIFLIISLVPVLTIGIIGHVNTERQITEETINKLDALASMQEEGIVLATQNNLERLVAFTTRLQLKVELDNFNRNGDETSLGFVNNLISSVKSQITSFKEISVLNPEGVVVASTDTEEVGVSYANNEFFTSGMQANDVTIFFKDQNGQPSVYLTGPLLLDGKLVGVAAITSDVANIYSITSTYEKLSETGESYLAKRDQNGDALFITPLRFDPSAVLNSSRISKDDANSLAMQALSGNDKTFTNMVDYRGKQVLATTRYIEEGVDLGLVVKIDKEEAFAALEELKILTVSTGVAGGILIIAVALFLGKSISSPITRLKDKATEISKGNFDVDIGISHTGDEVDELAIHFDKMRQSVKSMNENLQQMIHEKTKELEAANDELRGKNSSLQILNTLLEKQKAQLSEADMEKEEFSAMITHELKTPLVPIIGFAELLLDGTLGELTQRQRDKVQLIHGSGLSLLRLISDLLDVRKLELGQMKFQMEDNVSAKGLVEDSLNALRPLARSKDVALACENSVGEDVKLRCDPKRIQQVLYNLLTNAIKFAPEKSGIIEVSYKRDDISPNYALFSVKDNGIGIPEDKRENIFKKFYQADTSLSRNAGGTGLGLAISKGIVEAHNGRIWFESKVGAGSTFYFLLPAPITKEATTIKAATDRGNAD